MNLEMMFATARIAEIRRELAPPMMQRRHQAQQRTAALRSRRRQAVGRTVLAGWSLVVGHRVSRYAAMG